MCERLPGYDLWKLDNGPYEHGRVPYENLDEDEEEPATAREQEPDDNRP